MEYLWTVDLDYRLGGRISGRISLVYSRRLTSLNQFVLTFKHYSDGHLQTTPTLTFVIFYIYI